jgi:streptomycin 6-kinase
MSMQAYNIPSALKERWHIRGGAQIADTRSSCLYRVEREDDVGAIVKILKPEGKGERPGMDFLEWRDGRGAVRLIDRVDDACLIEDAGTVILRDHWRRFGDVAATEIILSVLAQLHQTSPAPPPSGLVPLRQHFRPLFTAAMRDDPEGLGETLRWAAARAEDILAAQTNIRPLHGDLHHDNIVTGGKRGWLAIDPQGLIGDPAYDVANVFGNPLGGAKDILDPRRIERLAAVFAKAIGCTEEKILRYTAAHAALSICWSREGEETAEALENIAERSAFAGIVRRMLDGGGA